MREKNIENHACTTMKNLAGKKQHTFYLIPSECAHMRAHVKERDIKTNHIQTCFHCVSTEVIVGNTNVMLCETKRRGLINVFSHGYWVKSVCYFLSRCNAWAFFSSECVSIEEIQM